jgi:hypothetical protein
VVEGLLNPQVAADVADRSVGRFEVLVKVVIPVATGGPGGPEGVGCFVSLVGPDCSAYGFPPKRALEVAGGGAGRAEQ